MGPTKFCPVEGKGTHLLGEGDSSITKIHAVDMEPYKIYNVKKICMACDYFDQGSQGPDSGEFRYSSAQFLLLQAQRGTEKNNSEFDKKAVGKNP
jgi:hypothetical protein